MKFIRVFVITLFTFVICHLSFIIPVNAQIPPDYVPCSGTADPEFHSLRPYQASPCNKNFDELSYICGNDLRVRDNITVTPGEAESCQISSAGAICHFNLPREFWFSIDPYQSEFPIAGNTENVVNSQSQIDEFNDAKKVNEYVSWYLNGTINRAEYPFLDVSKDCIGETTQRAGVCLNTQPVTGFCLSSGLIHFPLLLLQADGKNSCGGGKKSCCVTINPLAREVDILDRDKLINYSGPINKLLPQEVQQQVRAQTVKNPPTPRHDQIVGCTYGIEIFGHEIGGIPGPCYETGLLSLLPHQGHRLSEWTEHLPPERWRYPNYIDYQIEYQRWRGKDCKVLEIPDSLPIIGNIPIIGGMGILLCYDDLGNPNFYSALYPYIPLSSTEDRLGKLIASDAIVEDPDGVEVADLETTWRNKPPSERHDPLEDNESALFFAHMEENVELIKQLQSTYLGKNELKMAQVIGETAPPSIGSFCKIVDVRYNKGDQLFGEFIAADVTYTAIFDCTFPVRPIIDPVTGEVVGYEPYGECTKSVIFASKIDVGTPKIDELWAKTVAGNASIFKRIFPKVGSQSPVDEIKDIPGVSPIVHDTDIELLSKDSEIYFPHLGGILEYFLKCIQSALRPKGYSDSICTSNSSVTPPVSCQSPGAGTTPPLPGGTGACAIKNNTLNLPDNLIKAIETASTSYGVPPSLMVGIMYGEGAFNPGSQFFDAAFVEEHLKECVLLPNCDPNASVINNIVPFFPQYWDVLKDAVKVVDPQREPNACNLLDGIFALAKDLRQGQNGSGTFAGKTCFGIPLNSGSGGSSSCSWDNSDVETAIRVWEFGTAYDSSVTCATKPGSCAGGGGLAAACPGGDFCEKVGGSGNTSHNGCVWDVYKNN